MDGHEIVIKGTENQSLPEGIEGELMVSGPSVAKGYYNNDDATEEILPIDPFPFFNMPGIAAWIP